MQKRVTHWFAPWVLLATGCYTWVPATSLADIHDDTVRISTPESTVTMEHATADASSIQGTPVTEGGRFEVSQECSPPACHRVDVKSADVEVRRIHAGGTAGIVVVALVGAALTFLAGVVFVGAAAIGSIR